MKRHLRYNEERSQPRFNAFIHVHLKVQPEETSILKEKGNYDSSARTKISNQNRGFVNWRLLSSWMATSVRRAITNGLKVVHNRPFLAGTVFLFTALFLVLSRYPCFYLCDPFEHHDKPNPPPPRTFEERVHHVQNVVQKQRQFLPLSADYIYQQESSNTDLNHNDWYDIFNCPMQPSPSYPLEFPIMNVLNHWPIADTDAKETRYIHQGLCVLDFAKHGADIVRQQMQNYQHAEKPFVVKNHPEALKSVERWNTDGYMDYMLQRKVYRGEFSRNLSMMYWSISRNHNVPKGFVPPTKLRPTTFESWRQRAELMENETNSTIDKMYLRLDACESPNKRCDALHRMWSLSGIYGLTHIDDADFIHDELPFLSPRYYDKGISKDFLIEPQKSRGIQCRFGAKGLVAEDHFDNERNFIAVLGGERRYLLSHPNNCKDSYLYPMAHPLERHTQVDWFAPNLTQFPNFKNAHINEVVLQAGDVLYLPTYWFHHIVSLSKNYQCNVRSGHSLHYDQDIYDCGFLYPWPGE